MWYNLPSSCESADQCWRDAQILLKETKSLLSFKNKNLYDRKCITNSEQEESIDMRIISEENESYRVWWWRIRSNTHSKKSSFLNFRFFTVHHEIWHYYAVKRPRSGFEGLLSLYSEAGGGCWDVGQNRTRVGHMSTTAENWRRWMITMQSQKLTALMSGVFSRSFLGALPCDGLQLLSVRLRLLLLLQELLSVSLRLAVRLLQLFQKSHFLLLHTQRHVCYILITALIN